MPNIARLLPVPLINDPNQADCCPRAVRSLSSHGPARTDTATPVRPHRLRLLCGYRGGTTASTSSKAGPGIAPAQPRDSPGTAPGQDQKVKGEPRVAATGGGNEAASVWRDRGGQGPGAEGVWRGRAGTHSRNTLYTSVIFAEFDQKKKICLN